MIKRVQTREDNVPTTIVLMRRTRASRTEVRTLSNQRFMSGENRSMLKKVANAIRMGPPDDARDLPFWKAAWPPSSSVSMELINRGGYRGPVPMFNSRGLPLVVF